jgi:PAS domain S-box-containing protein
MMEADQGEEELLRSVALQNAKSILVARQRAEQELIESKQALEQKTEELTRAKRRLTLLTRVANNLMLADMPRQHLKATFATVAAEIGANYFFNYSFDEAKPELLTLESSGGLEPSQEADFRRIEIGRSVCGRVAESRRPLVVDNIHLRDDEPTAPLRRLGARAYMGVPLLAHGHLFGTIGFASTSKSRFPEADIELLKMLADQCAAMLDRGRLLENLRNSEARYRTALAAGRAGTWETDFVARTRTWSAEGMALFGLDLVDGRGRVGGEADEYVAAIHPDDRHLARGFHELADQQDSFPAEYRIVRPDGSIVWLWGYGQVIARGADGKAERLISIMVDITERKKAEDHIKFLLLEVSHRAKNLLSVIQAIAGQTVRTAGSLEEFETRFGLRLHGLAASHDILVSQSWQGAPLADLVRLQLAPFAEVGSSRLELVGPNVVLAARAAQGIGLALHELATNAAKHGALSIPTGNVRVSWAFEDVGAHPRPLRLSWAERGGPPAAAPSKRGFGYVVIERMAASAVSGEATMEFAPEGLRWVLSIPAANLVNEG